MKKNCLNHIFKKKTYTDELGILHFDSRENVKTSYDPEGHTNCFEIEDSSFWFNFRNSIISATIKNHMDLNDIFFDVGGGNGFVSKKIQELGYQTTLIEPNYSSLLYTSPSPRDRG